jgi:hypothetical protein
LYLGSFVDNSRDCWERIPHMGSWLVGNKHRLNHFHTPEAKRKMALASMGKKYHLGHRHSEETKRKISLTKTGKKINYPKHRKRRLSCASAPDTHSA